jgi:hypothetical protein
MIFFFNFSIVIINWMTSVRINNTNTRKFTVQKNYLKLVFKHSA